MDLSSDINLLVIGDHDTLELQKKVSQFQKSIDREINIINMDTKKYNKKHKTDPFLMNIHRNKSIPIV